MLQMCIACSKVFGQSNSAILLMLIRKLFSTVLVNIAQVTISFY